MQYIADNCIIVKSDMSKKPVSNKYLAQLLRQMAASYVILGENYFKINSYEKAAETIEQLNIDASTLLVDKKTENLPGIGPNISNYLREVIAYGKSKHFEETFKKMPFGMFHLLNLERIGAKTAFKLASFLHKTFRFKKEAGESGVLSKLEIVLKSGKVDELEGFGAKKTQEILNSIANYRKFKTKKKRFLLSEASMAGEKILEYLKKGPGVKQADSLGSLRRQVATIGDLDFAVSAQDPDKVYEYFNKMPGVSKVTDKQTVVLKSGVHVDLLVGKSESYGALLQHFTGGKNHNIKLRTYALKKGLSLNENGITRIKNHVSRIKGETIPVKTEAEFYKMLGMDVPAPEIREDNGEIEAALENKLPRLVELKDIKGDFHLHSNFPIDSSHDYGTGSLEELIKKAVELGYDYVGLSDHAPAMGTHTKEQIVSLIEKRTKVIQQLQLKYESIRVLNGLEIDITSDGSLALPEEALKMLDYTVVGIHSGHRGSRETITKRILTALENPYTTILAHPTGRLLNERESFDADWEKIFQLAAEKKKLLEINAYPNRLDLRDDLVRQALMAGCKFMIDTDSHAIEQMLNMPFGVSVARRGWATKEDIANTWEWKKLSSWFRID